MVIDPGNNINTASHNANRTKQSASPDSKSAKSEKPVAANVGDSVSLSAQGQNLAKLEAAIAQSPEVNESKVAQIKAAIDDGSYKVDADSIADKMLKAGSQ